MAVAQVLMAGRDERVSVTWRQFQKALFVMAAAVAVGVGLYGVETGLLGCDRRCVENPVETMMRGLGIAHFLVGWLFLLTSPGLRRPANLLRLLAWATVGVGLCVLYQVCGATKNPLVVIAFYSFFLVHEVRDETDLFCRYGEGPPASPERDRFLLALGWAVSLLLAVTLAAAYLAHGRWVGKMPDLDDDVPGLFLAGWVGLCLAAGVACWHAATLGRQVHGRLREVVSLYGPLLRVYAGILGVLLLGSFVGSVGLNLMIVLHVAAWLVYVHHQLSRSAHRPTGVWSWLRRTPAGFLTLHLGLAAGSLLLFALRTHVWDRTGLVCDLLARSSFAYWTLMHIAIAFARAR